MSTALTATRRVAASIRVRAPARLHLGFIDPGASLGRRYGSIGLVIDGPATELTLMPSAPGDTIVGADDEIAARLRSHLATLRRAGAPDDALRIELHQALPPHAGLGSGTQLALALGRACATLFALPLSTAQLVALLGRGARSGIGSAGFDEGGFLVDGGPPSRDDAVAPVLFRIDFPAAWRVLLVQDPRASGLHGDDERRAIAALPPFPREHAARISHEVLMRVLPALKESDFAPFAEGISTIQRLIGAHFAPAQGGDAYTSVAVARLLRALERDTVAGIGQSSWGPTGFALLPSAQAAQQAIAAARRAGAVDARLQLSIVGGRNHGADITTESRGDT